MSNRAWLAVLLLGIMYGALFGWAFKVGYTCYRHHHPAAAGIRPLPLAPQMEQTTTATQRGNHGNTGSN